MPVQVNPARRPFPYNRTKSTVASTGPNTAATSQSPSDSHSSAEHPRTEDEQRRTAGFVHQVLCQQKDDHQAEDHLNPSQRQVLPSLTSSNDVDLQLYAFIAMIINDNVSPWYSKITADPAFVEEIVHVIAHCTRGIEERLRKVDLVEILFNDVADLVLAHLEAWRTVQLTPSSQRDIDQAHHIFHTLRPHPALSPVPDLHNSGSSEEQQRDESAYCNMLSQALLAILLPVEDLQNPCLFALVSDILADLVLGNFVGNRICQASFVYDCVRRASDYAGHRLQTKPWLADPHTETKNRLKNFGLVSEPVESRSRVLSWSYITTTFWMIAQLIYLSLLGLRALFKRLLLSSSLPYRKFQHSSHGYSPTIGSKAMPLPAPNSPRATPGGSTMPGPTPILKLKVWQALSKLLWIDIRMPWLQGFCMSFQSLALHGVGHVGSTNKRLDRLLTSTLLHPFQPIHIAATLSTLRTALFPNNTAHIPAATPPPLVLPTTPKTAPPPPPSSTPNTPSATSAASINSAKRAAAVAILNAIPRPLAVLAFPPRHQHNNDTAVSASGATEYHDHQHPQTQPRHNSGGGGGGGKARPSEATNQKKPELEAENSALVTTLMTTVLAPFDDIYLNKHLVWAVVECVVARIVPEIASASSFSSSCSSSTGGGGGVDGGGGKRGESGATNGSKNSTTEKGEEEEEEEERGKTLVESLLEERGVFS